eukprot:EG_transcript_21848
MINVVAIASLVALVVVCLLPHLHPNSAEPRLAAKPAPLVGEEVNAPSHQGSNRSQSTKPPSFRSAHHAGLPVLASQCSSYITITPREQGRGIATIQANRNCALFIAMRLAHKGLCYAHPASHAGHVVDPNVWERFLGFGRGFRPLSELKSNKEWRHARLDWFKDPVVEYQSDLTMESKMAEHLASPNPRTVYELQFGSRMFNNCHSAPLLRHLYFQQRREDQATGAAPIPVLYDPQCWAVALHWRRGDVMSPKHASRQLPASYFLQVARMATHAMSQQSDKCIRPASQLPKLKLMLCLRTCG